MLSEQVKRLLNTPELTRTEQGVNTYPRVIWQEPHGDSHMLVTFAEPGLKRRKMLVPLAEWIEGRHLDAYDAYVAHSARLLPLRDTQHPL